MSARKSASLYERLHAANARLRKKAGKYARRAIERKTVILRCHAQHRAIVERLKSEHEEETRALREQIERLKDPN